MMPETPPRSTSPSTSAWVEGAALPTEATVPLLYDEYLTALRKRGAESVTSALDALAPPVTALEERLRQLEMLKGWLDSFRPFPLEVVQELKTLYTVRLTYHSNAIEGNTLTQSETEMVLSHGVTVGGKTLVEHLEVIGHRDAMEYMGQMAQATTSIGEWEIRNLHSLILQPIDGATGGHDAGRYRTLDVRAAGTEHIYPPHYQVPELMAKFAAWMASEAARELHPVEFASQAHFRFVSIHPFRDGNGRAGRLLMNLLLLRAGYPIAVITNARRAEYIEALVYGQSLGGGDAENASRLTALVAQACRESLLENLALLSTAGGSRGRGGVFYRAVLPLLQALLQGLQEEPSR